MSIVGFEYPEKYQEVVEKLKTEDKIEKEKAKKTSLPDIEAGQKGTAGANIEFNYVINGEPSDWKPVRATDAGV